MDFQFNKASQVLLRVAAIGTATLAIVSVYTFYRQNIWFPKITLVDVDYNKGIANLIVNKKPLRLEGNSAYSAGSSFGIQFGTTNDTDGRRAYDRIEIVKNGLVRGVINKNGEVLKSFTANEKTYYDDVFNGFTLR
jgi:hypothetical protein